MDKVILNLIKLQNQLRFLHWQTTSFAEHKAFGKGYDNLDGLLDKLVETYQGKHGRIIFPQGAGISLYNYNEIDIKGILSEVTEYLSTAFNSNVDSEKDTDCLNIRDEMLSELNTLKYLLTLQ